jgi:hypothetical protein
VQEENNGERAFPGGRKLEVSGNQTALRSAKDDFFTERSLFVNFFDEAGIEWNGVIDSIEFREESGGIDVEAFDLRGIRRRGWTRSDIIGGGDVAGEDQQAKEGGKHGREESAHIEPPERHLGNGELVWSELFKSRSYRIWGRGSREGSAFGSRC